MENIEILGLIAGAISSVTFVPQVIKTYKAKSAKGISLLMFSLVTISVILWLIYGIYIDKVAIIFTNAVVLILSMIMIYFKLKYKD